MKIKTAPLHTTELVKALRSLARPAQAEKGLITWALYLDANDPNTVCFEEVWDSREELEKQICSRRYTQLLGLLESAEEQPTLEFRFISQVRGLDYVAELRSEGTDRAEIQTN